MTTITYNGDHHVYRREPKGHNIYCFCNSSQERIDGTYECTFKQREKELLKQISEGKIHTCTYKKRIMLQKTRQLTTYFTQIRDNEDKNNANEITYDDILTKVALVVGGSNLSLEAGASPELQDLIITAIKFGMQHYKANIDDVFKKYSADTVRQNLIAAAIDIRREQFKIFSMLKYVGVSCDEGTTRGIHDLDFVLENPLSGYQPFPCFTSVMTKGTATHYTEHLAIGLEFIRINNIPVGSITIDGNRAQLKALSYDWLNSLRHRYKEHNDFTKHIIVNPCLCHRVNNAYKAAYRKSESLKKIVNNMRALSQLCRSCPEKVNGVCPKIQNQRWIVDFDICDFLLKHYAQIKASVQLTDGIYYDEDELKKLHRVLSILKSMVLIFEDPSTPHFKAFRIIENAIGALQQIETFTDYCAEVKNQLIHYCQNSKLCGIWMLSYILTPEGRFDFHQRIVKRVFPPDPDYSQMFQVHSSIEKEDIVEIADASLEEIQILQTPENYQDEVNKILADKVGNKGVDYDDNFEEDDYEEEEDTCIQQIIEQNIEEEESIEGEQREKKEEDKEQREKKEEEERRKREAEILENHVNLIMGPAQDFLEQTLKDWGVAKNSRQMVLSAFNSFVHKPYDIYSKQTTEEGDYLWEQIIDDGPLWNAIGEIAMRLHCSPCSEASCERTISTQRLVLTARRMSSKKELLDARLTILQGIGNRQKNKA